ncbi:Chitinase 2 [Sporothrix curviconia]|uniref:Chitinase 2 n=1 Tax=Sporothrix curviconia TaxID=1260050 RepID=A0ABP0C1B0_9PEZI
MRSLALATLASLAAPALAAGKINVYWGQNGDRTLAEVCQQDAIDYVTMSLVNQAPEQDGTTNYPGMEFAAHCPSTTYEVDGVASNLIQGCTDIIEGIPVCQAQGIKVLLSIGGVFDAVSANYNVTTEANGRYFADFLWGAFGPYNASWTGPRPFDASATEHTSVDGFDFDIEAVFPTEDPWIAMIEQLRGYWGTATDYLITGAPQCPIVTDATLPMKRMIAGAQFDLLWVQFYNNQECDGTTSSFNFDQWVSFLPGTRSAHAQLYIGLPADVGASGYLDYAALSSILTTYGTSPSFGGVMLWDEYFSFTNTDALSTTSEPYVDVVRQILASVTTTTTTTTTAPASTATPSSCSNPYTVKPTDDCYDLAATHNTTVVQILALNPQLDAACDLTTGQTICLPQSCTQYYIVEAGNSCYTIDMKYGITFDQLQAMNPGAINDECTNLDVGQALCVSTGSTLSSSSLPPSVVPTTTTAPSPSPVVCTAYYTVKAGDSCYTIDLGIGISFAQLQSLNPGAINADCTNLGIGQVLCVAAGNTAASSSLSSSLSSLLSSSSSSPLSPSVVPTTTTVSSPSPVIVCTASYTVKAGDSCYTIDLGIGISFDQLLAMNPGAINADCTNLGIGQVLCVGEKNASSSTVTTTLTSTISTTVSLTSTLTSTAMPLFTNSSSSFVTSTTHVPPSNIFSIVERMIASKTPVAAAVPALSTATR